jgi:hypothetical protein
MTRIVLDASVVGQFTALSDPAELCDESGRVLGRFLPLVASSPGFAAQPQLGEAELQRREQEPDYSTADVLAYLEKL